ncbi:hypothetical protein [uncultured Caulobacter sp.]|uniref:hypothetical protein n=1 Tax=uncultured Caulobacter sp. TaxID=158749 RepID=UPI0026323EEE|nr:hypothetical protein [uncultured Caulobacter sp.]
MTIASTSADSWKVKDSGLIKPCRVAKKAPAKPPNIAPAAANPTPQAKPVSSAGDRGAGRTTTEPLASSASRNTSSADNAVSTIGEWVVAMN